MFRLRPYITILLLFAVVSCSCAYSIQGKCVGVSDGDTITILQGKTQYKIRYHGIDAPEKNQPFGQKAKQFNSNMVFGKLVKVDVQDTDRYGRLVGKVYVGKIYVNAEMLKNGFAWHYTKYDNSQYLQDLENEARKAKRGLWADKNPVPPWEFRNGKNNSYQPKTEQPQNGMVYVTRNGKCYHLSGCKALRGKIKALSYSQTNGYRPCKICNP